ncbi:MAG: hypothetical protein ACJAZP_003619 [Psychromonas sp.]
MEKEAQRVFLSIQRASLINEMGIDYLTVIFIERQKDERS